MNRYFATAGAVVGSIEEINNLAESIKEYGIIEPLIVRQKDDKYEIISGKKRYQAARIAGQSDIPVLVRNIDKKYPASLSKKVIENIETYFKEINNN